jgi:prepilin-type N-terminal cleavage/methylation domain-containing protein
MRTIKQTTTVSSGFSVAELVVALSIMAVLAVVAIPNILSYLPRSRLSGAARVIAAELAAARMAAVKQNCRACVTFINTHSYQIWVDADNNRVRDGGETAVKDLHPKYHDVVYNFFRSTAINERIGFSSRGTGSGIGTFVINNTSGSKRIVVNLSGRVKIR